MDPIDRFLEERLNVSGGVVLCKHDVGSGFTRAVTVRKSDLGGYDFNAWIFGPDGVDVTSHYFGLPEDSMPALVKFVNEIEFLNLVKFVNE